MNTPIKIALVDDECLFLEGLALLFKNVEKINVVITANSGSELLNCLIKSMVEDFPDVVLVDIQMKPMDGFEVVRQLRMKYPNLNIIILSTHYKNTMFGHMLKMGVSAFLPKNAKLDLLIEAIEKVHKTGMFFSQKDYAMLESYVKDNSQQKHLNIINCFSDRELEILRLICAEYTNQEIAEKLYISKRTVESHRHRLQTKTKAKNIAGLVIFAVTHGIYSLNTRYLY